ncbi:MAG: hypothetical protein KKE02_21650 [Alphaproteobacteria bacterium]|nr:hypothetical protein [Alphaproteobacteria bacterium]MBU1515948.1 hypothetical protein [Alphaproteobacteria bacterium]MBU2092837.1 hypothetical protein [Alphaproteobacteria bacterium]MBU2153638.1 hypothetical protein [Alphaproteobacteria bacterium]MBU2308266.1 hypothetical protein [Alphaproteobacteria bacterium]
MKLAVVALALSAAALSGSAFAAKPPPLATPAPAPGTGLPAGQCIRSSEIRNHTIADRNTLLIDVRGKDTYRVTMNGGCLAGAISSDPIITRSPPGASIICKPIDMDIAISRGGFPSQCIVDSIVKLSPEEVAALPRKLKP